VNGITNEKHEAETKEKDNTTTSEETLTKSTNLQETLANISDTGHSTPDPQEILANISDTGHSTNYTLVMASTCYHIE
jgi:hypothetical protein